MPLSYKLLICLICSKFQRIGQVVYFHGKPPTYDLVYKVPSPSFLVNLEVIQNRTLYSSNATLPFSQSINPFIFNYEILLYSLLILCVLFFSSNKKFSVMFCFISVNFFLKKNWVKDDVVKNGGWEEGCGI